MQKKDILEASNAYVLGSDINPKFVGTAIVSFESGATWANEQNAAEIARWQAIADDLQAKRVDDAEEIARLRTLISDIRAADIKNKIESGLFSLPKEIRERIQVICEK